MLESISNDIDMINGTAMWNTVLYFTESFRVIHKNNHLKKIIHVFIERGCGVEYKLILNLTQK